MTLPIVDWRDDEAIERLARLPWTVRTSRSEFTGEHRAWILEMPGTCAVVPDPAELPAAIEATIRRYLRTQLYLGEPIVLPEVTPDHIPLLPPVVAAFVTGSGFLVPEAN